MTAIEIQTPVHVRKASLERTLHRLLQRKVTKVTLRIDLTGAAAESWMALGALAAHLDLTHEDVLSLLLHHASARVKRLFEEALQSSEIAGN